MDADAVFAQWRKQNATASLILMPKMNELMSIWQSFDVPVTVILFYLKSMARIIEAETKEHIPVETHPAFDDMLEELDFLIGIHAKNVAKTTKPLHEILSGEKEKKEQKQFNPLYG